MTRDKTSNTQSFMYDYVLCASFLFQNLLDFVTRSLSPAHTLPSNMLYPFASPLVPLCLVITFLPFREWFFRLALPSWILTHRTYPKAR